MAFDKKSSLHTGRAAVGAADELDAYGVWVKSEPQDLASGLADALDFGAGALPYEADYNADDIDVSGLDIESSDIDVDAFHIGGYGDDAVDVSYTSDTTSDTQNSGDASSQLLSRIADELSSIRSELSTLKREFADIRAEKAAEDIEETPGGFFAGEEDDKIALTGDEMENILISSELAEEDPFAFDSLREEDEAALRNLAMKGESSVDAGSAEEINIDFENLGIDLDDGSGGISSEDEAFLEEEEPLDPLPAVTESDFDRLEEGFASANGFDDAGELQELRLEGAAPFTPAPENIAYLEDDPFAEDHAGPSGEFADLELNLDESSFNINLDDLEMGTPSLEEDAFDALDLSRPVINEPEQPIVIEPIADDELKSLKTQEDDSLDDFSLDLDDITVDESADEVPDTPAASENDDSIIQVIPEALEVKAAEPVISFDDDLDAFGEEEAAPGDNDIDTAAPAASSGEGMNIPSNLKKELKGVFSCMEHLLEALPEDKIEEFAHSEYFHSYKKLYKDLGLV